MSCYYSPLTLLRLLREFAHVWESGGTVRLILGYQETAKLVPMLRGRVSPDRALSAAVGKAMLGEAAELGDLLKSHGRRVIPAIRQLLDRRAMHVRLVTTRANLSYFEEHGSWPEHGGSLFHSKFGVYWVGPRPVKPVRKEHGGYFLRVRSQRQLGGRFAVINGSFNETEPAYGENIEDAVLHRSWISGEAEVATYFAERFERLWIGGDEDVVSMPFDDEFRTAVEHALERANPRWFSWKGFSQLLNTSPIYGSLALPGVGLLPHQHRVLLSALGRWPVRALLGDEVGLGKTIEAGAILRYLLEHGGARRVLVLTPASLRLQWQRQLERHFGLKFWVYDSSRGVCSCGTEEVEVGDRPLDKVPTVIASWHWARVGATSDHNRLEEQQVPDVLVVDEAHHARVHQDLAGRLRSTLLFELVRQLGQKTPHLLLLTATPFQTASRDYYSQLDLLGLPPWFSPEELERFAAWSRGRTPENFSFRVKQATEVRRTGAAYSLAALPKGAALQAIEPSAPSPSFEDFVREAGPLTREEYLRVHPTTLLTLRNTRKALKAQNYHFPEAVLTSADIVVSKEQEEWLAALDRFVQTRLGSVEAVTNGSHAIGWLRCLFRQRAVSSIRAARDSLNHRLSVLEVFQQEGREEVLGSTLGPEADVAEAIEEAEAPALSLADRGENTRKAERRSATSERLEIQQLLAQLEDHFSTQGRESDPKMEKVSALVESHLREGRQILVFSRFTSTTSAVIEALADIGRKGQLGRYDGQQVGVYGTENGELVVHPCERREVENALKSGQIKVLVCSDAASEGLDLQSASVVINVDVPWNPSRVLQRFGRVDRLGQTADRVFLVNAYYPHSIEERMYQVLEDRRLDCVAVLGEVPEILAEQQKRFVEALGLGEIARPTSFREVQDARESLASAELHAVAFDVGVRSPIDDLVDGFVRAAGSWRGSKTGKGWVLDRHGVRYGVHPLDLDFLSWASDSWTLFEQPVKKRGIAADVAVLESGKGQPLGFVLVHASKCYPLDTSKWGELFGFLFAGDAVNLDGLPSFKKSDLAGMYRHLSERDNWIRPDHKRMRTLSAVHPPLPDLAPARLRMTRRYVRVLRTPSRSAT